MGLRRKLTGFRRKWWGALYITYESAGLSVMHMPSTLDERAKSVLSTSPRTSSTAFFLSHQTTEATLRARRRTRNRSRAPLTKKGQIHRLQGHLRSNDLLPRQGQQQHYKYRDILEGEDGARGQYCHEQELNPGPQRPQGRPAVVTREGARPWSSGRLTDHSNQTTTQRHTGTIENRGRCGRLVECGSEIRPKPDRGGSVGALVPPRALGASWYGPGRRKGPIWKKRRFIANHDFYRFWPPMGLAPGVELAPNWGQTWPRHTKGQTECEGATVGAPGPPLGTPENS